MVVHGQTTEFEAERPALVPTASYGHSAADLVLAGPTLDEHDYGGQAIRLLESNPDLPGVAVMSGDSIIGYVDRASLLARFSRPMMRELYERRPVTLIMDSNPLVVEEETSIRTITQRIAEHNPKALTAGFIVVRKECYRGVGTATALLRLSLEESESQTRELALAHERLTEQKATLNTLADSFERTLEDVVEMIGSASIEMRIAAQALAAISEVGRRVAQSSQMSRCAVKDARETNETVARLNTAAVKIGEIVGIIKSIADQTNLLALNATIESAHAGLLGRGFAVVAGEVKVLANKTARATGEISEQVSAIQGFTGEAVGAIQTIEQTIQKADEMASEIVLLVEQNATATNDILAQTRQTRRDTLANPMDGPKAGNAADDIGYAATQVFGSASRLLEHSKRFESELRTFLTSFRAM